MIAMTWAGAQDQVWQLQGAMVDLDGTMVDTLGDFTQAIARMLHAMQLPPLAASAIEHMVGKGTEHLLRSALAAVLPLSATSTAPLAQQVEALYPQAHALYMEHYIAINGAHSKVYDGVAQGLQALKAAGMRLACVTNKPLAFTTPLLQAKGLADVFEVVLGGDSLARKKPDPLPLLTACEWMGTLPQHTLMLGDSSNDAQAARAAGCPVVLVSYGYNHGQPIRSVDADGYVDTFTQLRLL